nr:chromosome alignment-maintaining phosphoprotein 1-like [Gasterosteus aculeatus aculeatus]
MHHLAPTPGEVGGAPAAHLQCPLCGHFAKSHAHQLTHMAAAHPARLEGVAVGRLGNIVMYQSGARLFHCADCFFTCRDFPKLYRHLISRHCEDQREGQAGETDAPGRKRSIEEELPPPQKERDEKVLMFDGSGYRCLICGWMSKLKALGVNHVVRKHDIPKAYASQAIRRGASAPPLPTEEEGVGAGLSGEQLKEEMEATAKVVRFISNRFVCLICGWKTKLKGFAISHVVRCHDVERPYACRRCSRRFFLPSRLQQHVRAEHRPGRYACPFCCFRSHFLGGFRRDPAPARLKHYIF